MKNQIMTTIITASFFFSGCTRDIANSLQSSNVESIRNLGYGLAIVDSLHTYAKKNPSDNAPIKEYDARGFDNDGINKDTGTFYNHEGFNKEGFNKDGFNKEGINRETKTKYNKEGYDMYGIHKNIENIENIKTIDRKIEVNIQELDIS